MSQILNDFRQTDKKVKYFEQENSTGKSVTHGGSMSGTASKSEKLEKWV